MLELTKLIIARYQRTIEPLAQSQPVAMAIVPCGAGARADALAIGLCRALEPGRRVLHLDPDRLRNEHAIPAEWLDDLADGQLAGWLQNQESRCDYVVYVADAKPSPWTRLCVRQADLILFVGMGNGEPDRRIVNDLEAAGRVAARRELVLLYDSSRAPTGTAAWLTALPVAAHHHVDLSRSSDVERLARLVTGTGVGLVLGGGGARGLAHIGVLRALEEAAIPIDLIGGTSIGAVVAAQHAFGWNSARVLAETERAFAKGSLNDFTIPVMALLHGKRYIRALEQLFGAWCIEDLPLWYFCVSTNLTRSETVVHRSGRLRKWVAASMAVPGLGPPIFDGRDVLVDGGVLNNLPVDVIRHFRRGRVIASNASPRVAMRLDRDCDDVPSPWRVLASRFNPFGTPIRVPSILNILTRAASLRNVTHETGPEFSPDLLIEPPVEGFRLLDWRAIATLVDIGYRSARAALEVWDRNPRPY
jgi:predicted acylesterase/phospholipase RssA